MADVSIQSPQYASQNLWFRRNEILSAVSHDQRAPDGFAAALSSICVDDVKAVLSIFSTFCSSDGGKRHSN